MNLEAEIGPRKKLSHKEYEEIHENKRSHTESILDGKEEFILVDVKTVAESRGERRYIFNE
jgi:hydroxymethylglutaryl-CoA synthase